MGVRFAVATVAAVTVLSAVVAGPGSTTRAAAAPAATGAGGFVPVPAARVLDTRSGLGAPAAAVRAHGTVTLQLAGRAGIPATGASAVAAHITATAATAAGHVTVFPAAGTRPATSVVNFAASETASDSAVVPLGTGGRIALYNGSSGTVQLAVDVAGYYVAGSASAPGALVPVAPARVLDTRAGIGVPAGTLAPRRTLTLRLAGSHGVPAAGAGAVALTVTATASTATGYLTVFPAGAPRPTASSVNFTSGRTVPNLVLATLGRAGSVTIYNGSGGSVQVLADVAGYFRPGAARAAGMFVPRPPYRAFDSRTVDPQDGGGPVAADHGRVVPLGGGLLLPAGTRSAVVNLTVTQASAAGHLTAYPSGQPRPANSDLNFVAGRTVAGVAVLPVGADGGITLFNGSAGTVQVIVDVLGFYGDGTLGAISGTTVDGAGHGVGGVVVHLGQASYTEFADPVAVTADDGTYSISGLAAADYSVCFAAHGGTPGVGAYGYSNECWNGEPNSADAVTVAAQALTGGVDAHLTAAAAIRGRVTDTGGHPLKGAVVTVGYPGSDEQTTSAADGSYTLRGLDTLLGDSYQICADDPNAVTGGSSQAGYLHTCADDSPTPAPGQLVTGDDVHMTSAAGVSGTVTDTAGHPLAGVPVHVACCGTAFNANADASTDAHGKYVVHGIDPALPHIVCFQGSALDGGPVTGYLNRCYKHVTVAGVAAPSGAQQVALTAGHTTTGIDENLPAAGAVSGTVRDGAGNPLPGVQVRLSGPDPVGERIATT
jgi:Carboxypeptidase regulatory-like domain